jgi:hypothetical protein
MSGTKIFLKLQAFRYLDRHITRGRHVITGVPPYRG